MERMNAHFLGDVNNRDKPGPWRSRHRGRQGNVIQHLWIEPLVIRCPCRLGLSKI